MSDIVASDGSTVVAPTGGKWLARVRIVWFAVVPVLFIGFLISIPSTYQIMATVCVEGDAQCTSWVQLPQESFDTLSSLGISLQTYAIVNLLVFIGFSAFCWVAGLLVLRYRSRDWHGLLVSYLLIALAAGGPSFVFLNDEWGEIAPLLNAVIGMTIFPMYLALSLFFQSFPDGRIYPRWARLGTLVILANYVVWIAPDSWGFVYWTPLVMGLWLLFVYGFHIGIQAYRYRYYYGKEQRQQTKWLVYFASIALVIAVSTGILVDYQYAKLLEPIFTTVGFYFPIVLGVTIALLRYRLWNIDVIINRTLVYGVLTVLLVGIYALVVSILGLLIQDSRNFMVSIIGAGTIAVLFQPSRQFIQRATNRLMFGKRDEPMAVIDELGKSLDEMLSPEAALAQLVVTTANTLKLPYVAVEDAQSRQIASSGKNQYGSEQFPLIYNAQVIGTLLVAKRSPGEDLNTADRLVLENVARQASNLVYASHLIEDLQESRRKILTAREEERRRLRRDLHDGLGPALATLTLQAEAAREWLNTDPAKSNMLLTEIIKETHNTLEDIRRIVYALRPPALDELGLISAIREQANLCTVNDLSVKVVAPEKLPPLPAAVEVATFRVVQEALTNVTRHAQAHHCEVTLQVNGNVEIEVQDDGVGIPETHHAGVGLNSMYERAAELGGSCAIESASGAGTRILVTLPRE